MWWILVLPASLLSPVAKLARREFLVASTFLPRAAVANDVDHYAHASFFGLAPPPIAGEMSYDELVEKARRGSFKQVQPAVQHDVLIATTHRGWRYASHVKDEDVESFLLDCMNEQSIPFAFLPRDPVKEAIHNAASVTACVGAVTYCAVRFLLSQ